jgi:hypothetical protein
MFLATEVIVWCCLNKYSVIVTVTVTVTVVLHQSRQADVKLEHVSRGLAA